VIRAGTRSASSSRPVRLLRQGPLRSPTLEEVALTKLQFCGFRNRRDSKIDQCAVVRLLLPQSGSGMRSGVPSPAP
jgi:hypothetical protein